MEPEGSLPRLQCPTPVPILSTKSIYINEKSVYLVMRHVSTYKAHINQKHIKEDNIRLRLNVALGQITPFQCTTTPKYSMSLLTWIIGETKTQSYLRMR
jgi:hypothetical protein